MVQGVHPLGRADFASAAELLAQAFYSNPCHVYMCPDPTRRLAQLEFLLGGNLRMYVQADPGRSFCLGRDGIVDAMGFWTRSDSPEIGWLPKIRAGLLAAPLRFGLHGLRRVFQVDDAVTSHRDEVLAGRVHWYLNNMVVRESLRGTGVGTRLLADQLRSVRSQDPDAVVALSTQRPENVRFYARLGFEVESERVLGRDAEPTGSLRGADRTATVDPFRNWIMVLPAGAEMKPARVRTRPDPGGHHPIAQS